MTNDESQSKESITRRQALTYINSAFALSVLPLQGATAIEPHQASGVKVGEVSDTTAIVWVRSTKHPAPNSNGPVYDQHEELASRSTVAVGDPSTFMWACPGAAGKMRVRFGQKPDLSDAQETRWVEVNDATDYQHQFHLESLSPGTRYYFASETASAEGNERHAPLHGQFVTAPSKDCIAPVNFALMNCQQFAHREHADGFDMYPAASALNPQFVVYTGDNVYYDRDSPDARSAALARFHWQRMYGLRRHAELLRNVGTYWIKDDHDTYGDDSWPGKFDARLGSFTFAEGQKIFREQVPMGASTYRTVRWGKDLQFWLLEGRDFRSPNTDPDGPNKSILGPVQKRWLKETLAASDATWRVLISATPWVGPDKNTRKADNHSNASFRHESDEMLRFFCDHLGKNFAVICGDRHWQYHSVHPEFGIHEFSIGPCSDDHAQHPEENPTWHRFFRDKGGFVSVNVARIGNIPQLTIRHHDTHGKVVHEWSAEGGA